MKIINTPNLESNANTEALTVRHYAVIPWQALLYLSLLNIYNILRAMKRKASEMIFHSLFRPSTDVIKLRRKPKSHFV